MKSSFQSSERTFKSTEYRFKTFERTFQSFERRIITLSDTFCSNDTRYSKEMSVEMLHCDVSTYSKDK